MLVWLHLENWRVGWGTSPGVCVKDKSPSPGVAAACCVSWGNRTTFLSLIFLAAGLRVMINGASLTEKLQRSDKKMRGKEAHQARGARVAAVLPRIPPSLQSHRFVRLMRPEREDYSFSSRYRENFL